MAEKLADDVSGQLTNEGLGHLIHEGFDPIVSSEEYTTKYGKELIECILDGNRDQTYEEFISKGKGIFVKFVGETINEMIDGFKEGESDCFKWIQANVENYHKTNTPENLQMLVKVKTTQNLMALKSAYEHYKLVVSQQNSAGKSVQNEDAEMEDAAEETPEVVRKRILAKYADAIARDKRSELVEQNPPSRAYSSTCSMTTNKELSKEEADISYKDYMVAKEKRLAALVPHEELAAAVKRNLCTGGGQKQMQVEEHMINSGQLPDDFVKAFLKMQLKCIKFRLSEDDDYQRATALDAPNRAD